MRIEQVQQITQGVVIEVFQGGLITAGITSRMTSPRKNAYPTRMQAWLLGLDHDATVLSRIFTNRDWLGGMV